ncbi:alpha/beta-hydrolase [Mycena maculata]|uniref:Alpha/beta-hydrolase n=1 Tax=Mycena maculata TaxID=230809 RepID=A0AAD7H9Z6_9AGAR|nr:alpha/beta-hydrolase [Mycena maculata]
MQALTLTSLFLGLLFSTSRAVPVSRSISSTLYDNLVLYTQYSSAAYQLVCPSPLGQTLVQSFSEGDTQGFIAQDDTRQEIVVSFRGTSSIADAFTDIDLLLVPLVTPGLTETFDVHSGFLAAYNSVAEVVLAAVTAQVAKFPTYTLVVTGHSLGASIAALAAVDLKTALPDATLQLYTFGQPRTGDANWAAFAESTIGVDNIFRGVHTFDGVPTIIPQALGYEHHATEYWQFEDPILLESPPSTVKQCVGGEDPTCSDSIPSTGINAAHVFYFGQVMAVNPLLCV